MERPNAGLGELVGQALRDSDLPPSQVPDIDLYMDQIITLFESRLDGNRRRPEDKLLTKTMINNYSKEGLIGPIKGKKYSKEHIVRILMIYALKQTLSIQDIKAALAAGAGAEPVELYERYLALKELLRARLPALLEELAGSELLDGLDGGARELLLVLALSGAGNYFKRLSEAIIDGGPGGIRPAGEKRS